MSIKGKPRSVDDFISAGNREDTRKLAPVENAPQEVKGEATRQGVKADFIENTPAPPPTVQKNLRLNKELAGKLAMEALELSLKHGVKVHEGAIVDYLLAQRYNTED